MGTGQFENGIRLIDGRILALAAQIYSGEKLQEAVAGQAAHRFLTHLDYADSEEIHGSGTESVQYQNRICLLKFAAANLQLFQMVSPYAPGMIFMGAMQSETAKIGHAEPTIKASFSGAGKTFQLAFERTVGEAVEFFSQFSAAPYQSSLRDLDICFNGLTPEQKAHLTGWFNFGRSSEIRSEFLLTGMTKLSTQQEILFPAALVFRGIGQSQNQMENYALSSGCAAGETQSQAMMSGLLEVIERDSAALWWQGGKLGRLLDFATLRQIGITIHLEKMRSGNLKRTTRLINITTEFDVPVVAAVSYDDSGIKFAAGISCKPSLYAACISALDELFQMELGLLWIEEKNRRFGETALDQEEQNKLYRDKHLNCLTEPLISRSSAEVRQLPETQMDENLSLPMLVERLEKSGHSVFTKDLTQKNISVPVSRAIVSGLQPYPSNYISKRLSDASQTGLKDVPIRRGIGLY